MKTSTLLPEVFSSSPLNRWSMRSPFRDFARMQDRMDRMFNEMWNTAMGDFPMSALTSGPASWPTETSAAGYFTPSCDIQTNDQQYLLSFDLPGVSKENLKVELIEDQLIVSGERKHEHHEKLEGTETRERSYGRYYRSFTLPGDVVKDKIQASYQDGVLQIALNRTGEMKTHAIAISDKPIALPSASGAQKGAKVA